MHCAATGGHIEVIKFLLPLFGERVHEKTYHSYTMLHCAAQKGHYQVARYLITELKMDPQDRDEVGGVPGDCTGFKVQGLHVSCTSVCVCVCMLVWAACCDKQVSPGHVYVMSYQTSSSLVL